MDGPKQVRHRSRTPESLSNRDSENVVNLHNRGFPAEAISQSLGLPIDKVESLLEMRSSSSLPSESLVAKALLKVLTLKDLTDMHFLKGAELENEVKRCQQDPYFFQKYIEAAAKKSQRYRCSQSGKMMRQPVVGQDGRFYDKNLTTAYANAPVMQELLQEAVDFSRSLVNELSTFCQLQKDAGDSLPLIADFLSMLDPSDDLLSYTAILDSLKDSQLPKLLNIFMAVDLKALSKLTTLHNSWTSGLEINHTLLVLTEFLCNIYLDKNNDKQAHVCLMSFLSNAINDLSLLPASVNLASSIGLRLNMPLLFTIIELLEPLRLVGEDSWHFTELKMRAAELLSIEGKTNESEQIIASLKAEWCDDKRFKSWLLNFSIKFETEHRGSEILQSMIEANFQKQLEAGLPEVLNETFIYLLHLVRMLRSEISSVDQSYREKLQKIEKLSEQATPRTQRGFKKPFVKVFSNQAKKMRNQLRKISNDFQAKPISESEEEFVEPIQVPRDLLPRTQSADLLPHSIYSALKNTSRLYVTNLVTGAETTAIVSGYTFKCGCHHVQLPNDSGLLFTGGGPSQDVVIIAPDFSWSRGTSMADSRYLHGSLYFEGGVYVIGGKANKKSYINSVQRYDLDGAFWETLPDMPIHTSNFLPQVIESTMKIYLIGGYCRSWIETIQEYSIRERVWRVLESVVPLVGTAVPCFKLSRDTTAIIFCTKRRVYSLQTETGYIDYLKKVAEANCRGGPCYYVNGIMYCSYDKGETRQLEIGSLDPQPS